MSEKNDFVTNIQTHVTQLAQAADELEEITEVYFDRGYNSGGGDAIADADISASGLTATEVGSVITMAQQLANFLGNSAVTQADYGATVNNARTDI